MQNITPGQCACTNWWRAEIRASLAQVMEEGERLSKKQLAQENTIKKLRAELAELRSEKGSSSASLAAERQKVNHMAIHMEDGLEPGNHGI